MIKYDRQLLIQHWQAPYHRCERFPSTVTATAMAQNKSCHDKIQIGMETRLNHNRYYFISEGCMVTISLASMMCKIGNNTTTATMLAIIRQLQALINQQPYNREQLQNLIIFRRITHQPSRIPCAQIVITAFDQLLNYQTLSLQKTRQTSGNNNPSDKLTKP